MALPAHAPTWAQPLLDALIAAGFQPGEEVTGGMAGYAVTLSRDDCKVALGGDRGDFDVTLTFPSPKRARGHPRFEKMPAEDYVAGVRGDTDATFLLTDSAGRHQAVAEWLTDRIASDGRLHLDEDLLRRIEALQRQRAKALFG